MYRFQKYTARWDEEADNDMGLKLKRNFVAQTDSKSKA